MHFTVRWLYEDVDFNELQNIIFITQVSRFQSLVCETCNQFGVALLRHIESGLRCIESAGFKACECGVINFGDP